MSAPGQGYPPSSRRESIGIGVVGCGGAAVDVVRAIDGLPSARLAAAYDQRIGLAHDLASGRGATVHGSLRELLEDESVEVVYVALPHDALAGVAQAALQAHRHVLVEKPMALTVTDIARLSHLAAESGRVLAVMFELREAAPVREVRRLVSGGAIGEVEAVRIQTLIDKPPSYWESGLRGRAADDWRTRVGRAGGGVVIMNTIHQLDLVRHLTGLEFTHATAETATFKEGLEIEEVAAAALRLSNGGVAAVAASSRSPGASGGERIEIDGSHGRIDVPDPYGTDPVRLFLRRPWNGLAAGRWHRLRPPSRDAHREFLAAFVAAVHSSAPPPAAALDAAAALAAVLALYASARSGVRVEIGRVDLDLGRSDRPETISAAPS
jgi:predicted dehydrogenase